MNKKEFIVYSLIILVSIFSVSYGVQYFNSNSNFKNDIYIFMEAARGNYNAINYGPGWIYKDYLSIFFKPLLLFNETTAYIVFSWVNTISFLILSHLTMKKKYGWIFVLAVLPLFKQALQSCSTSVTLALLLVNPYTALVAVLFKPHFVVFPLFYSILFYIRKSRGRASVKTAKFNFDNPDLLSDKKIKNN